MWMIRRIIDAGKRSRLVYAFLVVVVVEWILALGVLVLVPLYVKHLISEEVLRWGLGLAGFIQPLSMLAALLFSLAYRLGHIDLSKPK